MENNKDDKKGVKETTEKNMTKAEPVKTARDCKVEKERIQYKSLITANPNYFGNLEISPYKPIKLIQSNKNYEELVCIGLNPAYDCLEGIIQIKQALGYGGEICEVGSLEYVRFYVDLYDNGVWHDVGVTSVRVHDIPGEKPLCYAVKLDFTSIKKICAFENIVKVKAILSYNSPPPANSPSFTPVYGNVVTEQVQIRPGYNFNFGKFIDELDLIEFKIPDPIGPIIKALDTEYNIPVVTPATLTLSQKKVLYAKKGVPVHRFAFAEATKITSAKTTSASVFTENALGPLVEAGLDFVEVGDLIDQLQIVTDGNKSYEELKCVGLDPRSDTLEAILTVKKSSGYSGGLCTTGSTEYVAFWIDFADGAGFTYINTATVKVYDLNSIPNEDLQYAVFLKADLSNHIVPCNTGARIVRVRAILSWETPPPPTNPNYVPTWGNREECDIQLRPGLLTGHIPLIETVGDIGTDDIDFSTGLATGDALISSFSANLSPFGRDITITGRIGDPPNSFGGGAQKFKYKVEVSPATGPDDWHPLTNKVDVKMTEWLNGIPQDCAPGETVCDYTLTATDDGDGLGDGWYEYIEDIKGPNQRFLVVDKLARWITDASMEGLWKIRITAKDPATTPPTVYAGFQEVRVRIDNTAPAVSLAITGATFNGNPIPAAGCGKFPVGTILTGTYSVSDVGTTSPNPHFNSLSISVTPGGPANGNKVSPSSRSFPIVPTSGEAGTWTLDTGGDATATPPIPPMDPCGYVLRLWGCDRTIVSSKHIGFCTPADVGFCLEEDI